MKKKVCLMSWITIFLILASSLSALAFDHQDCIFSPDPGAWQYEYHVAYRLSAERTSANTPTGHIQVQPISGTWDYQGTVLVYVNGTSVNLFRDFNLQDGIGKSYAYRVGQGSIDIWFYTDFDTNSEIKIKHMEDRYGFWYITWDMDVSCPNPDDTGPSISVTSQPGSGDIIALGQNVPIKWNVTDSGTVSSSSLSLYQNNTSTLYHKDRGGFFTYNWTAANVSPGSGYYFHFVAVDDAGNFTERNSPTFTIDSDFIMDIPGYWLGHPDKNGTATPEAGFGVNSVSGNFYYEEVDASLPGIELPFVFRRSYNSRAVSIDSFGNELNLPLGSGWSHSYNIQLRVNALKTHAEVIWDDGRRDRFEKNGGQWQAVSPGNFTELNEGSSDYAWRLKTEDQTEYRFDAALHLTEIRARTGHAVQLEYQGNNLVRIVDTANRAITLSYTDDLLVQVDLPPSRNFRFEYTNDGYLSKVWDMRGNYHRYLYRSHDGYMMLAEIYRANIPPESSARPELQIIYNDECRVTEQHTAHTLLVGSPGYLFNWLTARTLVYNSPTAQGATFNWNEYGQVTKITPHNFPVGSEENITYAASQGPKAVLPQTRQDLLGHSYSFAYNDADSPNNASSITLHSDETYDFDFDSTNDLVSLLTPEGLNTNYVRNTFGKPDRVDITGPGIPATIRTDITYQLSGTYKGQASQVADSGNTEFQIVSRTVDGQPTEVRHYTSGSTYLTTRYLYDGAGRLVSTQDHMGTYTCFYYDDNDNLTDVVSGLTSSCSMAPASISVRHTHHEYDAENRTESVTQGYGGSESQTVNYHYNESGVIEQIDSSNRAVQYFYDNDLRLYKTLDVVTDREDWFYQLAGGTLEIVNENANQSQNTLSRIERREYDANGNLVNVSSCAAIDQPDVSSSDCTSDDRRVHIQYDDRERVTQVLESLELDGWNPTAQRATDYVYTDGGRTVTVTHKSGGGVNDGAQNKKIMESDAAGRLIRVTDFDGSVGYTAQAEYDSRGRVTKIIDPANLETTYSYDRMGRPSSQTDLRGRVEWIYDDNAGKVTREEPDGSTVVDTYDRLGQLSHRVTSDGNTFSFFYDSRGRLYKELWDGPGGTGERIYDYNVFGELMSVDEPSGMTVSYARSTAGRINYKSYAGINIGYTYDAFGNITAMDTPAGDFNFAYQSFTHALDSIQYPNSVTTSYQRNPLGELENLASSHASLGNFLQYGITLDAVGRRKNIQVTQPIAPQFSGQNLIFNYQTDGLLDKLGDLPVNYDERGNITALPSPVAGSFVYDVLNRLTRVDATQHRYDADRNRIETVRKGVTTRYLLDMEPGLPDVVATMDGTNQAQEIFIHGPGGLLAAKEGGTYRFVHQDFNHNVVALTDSSGSIAGSFAYTPYGVRTGAQGESDFPFQFAGGVGTVTDPEGIIQMRARYYHPGIRQFTSADLVPGVFERPQSLGRYGYVEGSIFDSVDPSGLEKEELRMRIHRLKLKGKINKFKRYYYKIRNRYASKAQTERRNDQKANASNRKKYRRYSSGYVEGDFKRHTDQKIMGGARQTTRRNDQKANASNRKKYRRYSTGYLDDSAYLSKPRKKVIQPKRVSRLNNYINSDYRAYKDGKISHQTYSANRRKMLRYFFRHH